MKTSANALSIATGFSRPALETRRERFGLAMQFDPKDVLMLKPLNGDTRTFTPAEQRALAAADKDKAQTAVIEQKYRPVDEIREAGGEVGKIITRELEGWEVEPERVERISQAIVEALSRF